MRGFAWAALVVSLAACLGQGLNGINLSDSGRNGLSCRGFKPETHALCWRKLP